MPDRSWRGAPSTREGRATVRGRTPSTAHRSVSRTMSVLLVATGGTIASRPTEAGVTAVLDGAALLERAGLAEGVDVLEHGRGPSWGLAPDAVESIART